MKTSGEFYSNTSSFVVRDSSNFINFLVKAFGAKEFSRSHEPDGSVSKVQVEIADSIIEVTDTNDEPSATPTVYMYVPDVDQTYKKAIDAGASARMEPTNFEHGDRESYIRDPFGNQWYIATPIKDLRCEF